jgi:hypothetical protein
MINIEWINNEKTCFQIKSVDETLFDDINNCYDITDIRNLSCCEAEYCPLNVKSFWRKLPYYLIWPSNNVVVINILFGGGLLTEYEQIKKYILLNKNKILSLTIRLIGSTHLCEIIELNKNNNILAYNNPFNEDINIMFSNKFLNIVITNVNKKIGLFGYSIACSIGFIIGILTGLIYRHYFILI